MSAFSMCMLVPQVTNFFFVNVSTLVAFGFYIQEKYLHVSVMSGGVVVKGRPLPPWG